MKKSNQKLLPDTSFYLHPHKPTGIKDGSPHTARKMCPENPRKHIQTPEERCTRAIAAKAREIKQLYTQDCKTFARVVKMLIVKDHTLERQLLSALRKNLIDIRKKSLKDLRQFISDVTVPLKPEQSARVYRNMTKRRPRRRKHI